MKKREPINSLSSLLHPFWIFLGLIASVSIIFHFEGLIHVKVGQTGVEFVIDSCTPSDVGK